MNTLHNDELRSRRPRAAWALAGLACAFVSACGSGGGSSGSSNNSNVQLQVVEPATGPFIGGTLVTLTGRKFVLDAENTVTFGGREATDVVAVDENTITCVTPAGAPGAVVDVVVTNTGGQGRLAMGFVYATPAPPTSDLNGDGLGDLLIASPADATGGTGAGAVYVYFGRTQSFQLDGLDTSGADLKITGQKAGDAFGACVCVGDLDGDGVADLIVGANKVDGVGALDAGAVYVFRGPVNAGPTMPAQAAAIKLTGSNAIAGDEFGSALEIGDMDGDHHADLLVGAPKHDVAGQLDAGCTYYFRGGATLASRNADQADHVLDGLASGDRLGARVACGDLDGDGAIDLVLGASGTDVQGAVLRVDAGRVFVLRGGVPVSQLHTAQAAIVIDGVAAGDRLGDALCVADLDGDGILDLAVSAPYQDSGEVDSGRVYVFRGGPGFVSGDANTAAIRLTGVANSGPIGQALRAGDFDGDSIADLLVGAPQATGLATQDGVVFVFRGGPTLVSKSVAQADAVLHGQGQLLEAFGAAVSAIDLDGDGFADLTGASPRWSGVGRVQVWRGGVGAIAGAEYAATADVTVRGTVLGGRFGESIARGQ